MSENDTLNLNNLKFLELDTTLTLRATLMLTEQNGLVLGSQSKRRRLREVSLDLCGRCIAQQDPEIVTLTEVKLHALQCSQVPLLSLHN